MKQDLKKTALWVIAVWLGAHAVLIAGHVLLVLLYSMVVAPGLSNAEYQEFARASGPWFSIVFGFPVFYMVGRLLSRRLGSGGRAAALAVWGLYSVTDLAIVLVYETAFSALLAVQWCVSQAVKLAAVWFSTRPDNA